MECVEEVMEEGDVIALDVVHCAAHAGVALAETEVVGCVFFGGFTLSPVPVASVLEVDDEDLVLLDHGAVVVEADVIDAADGFFEDLRAHDGGTDGEDDAAVELFHCTGEPAEVGGGGAADGGAVEDGVIGDDIVADARVDREGDALVEGVAED
ncbi:MAG: hypothetical protein RI897_1436 [Verrucomicrobiota bacterium]